MPGCWARWHDDLAHAGHAAIGVSVDGPTEGQQNLRMAATDSELATVLASALKELVEYVDARTDDDTEDDDVRALEDVAAVLHQVSPEAQTRLREMWGEEFAEELGLE